MTSNLIPIKLSSFALAASLFISMCCLLGSCIPEPLEVKNVPTIQPELVVATQMIPDVGLVVLLTRTFGALDASSDSDPDMLLNQIAVNDAEITLYGPSGTYTLERLEYGEYGGYGVYGGIHTSFQAGETYELRIKSASLGEVYATTTVQAPITFEAVEAELYYNEFNDTLAQITYSLQDPPEKNWYTINVQEVEREDVVQNLINPRAFTVLLDDTVFNGQLYQAQFRVFPRDFAPGDTIAVSLSNVSEDYYKFLKLRMDNRFSFVEFLGEPINYPSNVVGGRGYFNLYVPDVRYFIFE